MARVPLEELVLQIHLLGLGPAAEFLARVIEPPPAKSITGAVSQLQAIGALTPEEAFTPLGHLLIPGLCADALSAYQCSRYWACDEAAHHAAAGSSRLTPRLPASRYATKIV